MKINIDTFISDFSAQFEDTPLDNFSSSTVYKNLDEWDSLVALTIIAMVDEQYNIKLSGNDIKDSTTIQDLYILIKSKING